MASNWRTGLAGPIPSHPMYEDNKSWLASRRPVPRVRNEGCVNAELQRGCMDLLFKMQALTTGGGELDRPRYRGTPVKRKDKVASSSSSSSSSDGEHAVRKSALVARPSSRRYHQRPSTPGHALTTSRTSHVSVRPSAPPPPAPQSDSGAIAALDSDIRLIRSELESLRNRVHTQFDTGRRPPPSRRYHQREEEEEDGEEERAPPDWVERTRRRREVEEEVTYRRANGEREGYRWKRKSSRSPERSVRFEGPPRSSLRAAHKEELANLNARERELVEERAKYEEALTALQTHRKELMRDERKRRAEKANAKLKEDGCDPDRPEGYRLVPDEERRAMLELMMQAEAEVRQRLGRLPVILDTYRSRQRKKELEEALDELQGAIAVYAQRKVYIQNNL